MINKKDLVLLIDAKIEECKTSIIEQWNNPIGTKTKHFVIDNVLPSSICQKIYEAFPKNGEGFF